MAGRGKLEGNRKDQLDNAFILCLVNVIEGEEEQIKRSCLFIMDLIVYQCNLKGVGRLSDDRLLFPMTRTDFENTFTVEADCTCRRLLLELGSMPF